MNINFEYSKEKDIWCLINKGKSSINSQAPTKTYELLIQSVGNNPTREDVSKFIDTYISNNNIDIDATIKRFEAEWVTVSDEYQKRAEKIFNVQLPNSIIAYLTINNRLPYSIKENYFFLCIEAGSIIKSAMHELWHFYTWYSIGQYQQETLDKKQYNDLKESLTVLLNVECDDLLPTAVKDEGYPQHQHIREKILELWLKDKNINTVWQQIAKIT